MSTGTRIEWTDATWNPVVGCSPISPGCDHCYAATMAVRLAAMGQVKYQSVTTAVRPWRERRDWNGDVYRDDASLMAPFHWKNPRRIFVVSMGDLFYESVPRKTLDKVFSVVMGSNRIGLGHTFQMLTKRPRRMLEYLTERTPADLLVAWATAVIWPTLGKPWMKPPTVQRVPLPNLWLGCTAENQEQADKRIPLLLKTPAAVRFVSVEPMLGAVDLTRTLHGLDWVICGGESGRGSRPMHPAWPRELRDQCLGSKVPFFFKQWGEWSPCDLMTCSRNEVESGLVRCIDRDGSIRNGLEIRGAVMRRVGKKTAGRRLDGRTWDETPQQKREVDHGA